MNPGTVIPPSPLFRLRDAGKAFSIIQQSEAMVIERFGKYRTTLTAGFNVSSPGVRTNHARSSSRFTRDAPDGNKYVQFSEGAHRPA